ncbi:hypothetical protein DE146DRAFT_666413 [Phaeosphaeria sp. MPI-PUGE-AT-0046c]|nr:hypothetical protein DE146DRAFT_666413 [Phaeosphaeria sp. MPI-PUGE-AT-0046c]
MTNRILPYFVFLGDSACPICVEFYLAFQLQFAYAKLTLMPRRMQFPVVCVVVVIDLLSLFASFRQDACTRTRI